MQQLLKNEKMYISILRGIQIVLNATLERNRGVVWGVNQEPRVKSTRTESREGKIKGEEMK